MHVNQNPDQGPPVSLPADRWVGGLRIALYLPPGLYLLWVTFENVRRLDFGPARLGHQISTYSWAFVWLWVALIGLILVGAGVRWLVYAFWPGWLGLRAEPDRVVIELGPFGRRILDLPRMQAVYRHELSEDDALRSTEDFMLPKDEVARRLPLLTHPDLTGTLNRLMDRFLLADEPARLQRLRPLIAQLRPGTVREQQPPDAMS